MQAATRQKAQSLPNKPTPSQPHLSNSTTQKIINDTPSQCESVPFPNLGHSLIDQISQALRLSSLHHGEMVRIQ